VGNDGLIGTSYSGYSALLRVNGSGGIVQGDSPAEIAGVRLSFHAT
jgi:hypothetical protein